MRSLHTVRYYSATKRNKALSRATVWVSLKKTTLDFKQTNKNNYAKGKKPTWCKTPLVGTPRWLSPLSV